MLRRPFPLTAVGLAAASTLVSPNAAGAAGDLFRPLPAEQRSLQELRWEKRPVLLFAVSDSDEAYARQMALFRQAEEGLRDRDIVVFSDLRPDQPGPLRQGFSPAGFKLVLVGKDGGVKLESDAVLSPKDLFAVIDRMPMRQREIRK